MKKSILFFTLVFLSGALVAQITVTNVTFPQTGDTLRTATDFAPTGIEITSAGGPFDWDFSSLSVGVQTETVFKAASEGSAFAELPTATHVVFGEQLGAETYFRITSDKVEFIAANGNDPTGFGINALFRFSPPIVQRRAPMTFPSNNTAESNLLIGFAWADLPPILTDSLALPIAPDSIRVRITSNRNDFVDAYGMLTIPGGTYDVLREKRTTISETRVDIKIPFLGWQDVTDLLAQGFEGLGVDTTITYDYFSNTEKEVIASITADANNEPTAATFKDNGTLTADEEILVTNPTVAIMPNPVAGAAHFRFSHFPKGEYQLAIHDLKGSLVLGKKVVINGDLLESVDLSNVPAAGYFFLLKNEAGAIVSRGKLMKQ